VLTETSMPGIDPEIDPLAAALEEITVEALVNLGQEINDINRANGWNVLEPDEWDTRDYKIPCVLALIHSEVSEALEAYRHGDRENFVEEMADVVIRVLDATHGLGMDLAGTIFAKLQKNRTRGFRHGGKRV